MKKKETVRLLLWITVFHENSNGENSEARDPLQACCKSYTDQEECVTLGRKIFHGYNISKRKEGKDSLKVTLAAVAVPARNYFLQEIIF